jgi:putative membrane-bound dehydrogenase-like protein
LLGAAVAAQLGSAGFSTAADQDAPKKEVIPHAQDKPPGPALSPEEALAKMKVPEGFTVELVAAEPDVVNPVAMTIDERGRFWITESFEYPRHSAGPGRDRIKILEDTDADGKAEKVTIFADDLNIPSGIAVGHGGVWVANAPDILFMQDTDGDGKADEREVVVTGFGRHDTHELPNSLTWGPDGWLYGLNGVFNPAEIKQNGKEFKFTCAMFRIHPKTREFQVFCEGTSNPWGIAFDDEGSAFVSACVIDHLWHLTETGYYHRQGGPYPQFTWKLESIVSHKHQKAAYCGITYFDSDAYPEKYRGKLYMGNIHGSCINVDRIARAGSTYQAEPEKDFLSANDAWFMPVVQKTGPDGSLYILDWYDRYHCYQDANRDPNGIDRAKGRLYRVRYKDTERAKPFNLAEHSDRFLVNSLGDPNVLIRDLAQRLLVERIHADNIQEGLREQLQDVVLNSDKSAKARMHSLWVLISSGPLDAEFYKKLAEHENSQYRAWAIRAAGNQGMVSEDIRNLVVKAADDKSPDVKLQVAIAARKIEGIDAMPLLIKVLATCGNDKLIPNIVWQNLHPMLEKDGDRFMKLAKEYDLKKTPNLAKLMPRVTDRLLARKK